MSCRGAQLEAGAGETSWPHSSEQQGLFPTGRTSCTRVRVFSLPRHGNGAQGFTGLLVLCVWWCGWRGAGPRRGGAGPPRGAAPAHPRQHADEHHQRRGRRVRLWAGRGARGGWPRAERARDRQGEGWGMEGRLCLHAISFARLPPLLHVAAASSSRAQVICTCNHPAAHLPWREVWSAVAAAQHACALGCAQVRSESRPEVEAFVHGALCVSYSGQCFSSEAWGGRSANRGQWCARPHAQTLRT